MANYSDLTRKEQVLQKLRETGGWVDGPELANEEVGGSEGLKRLRELRQEGHDIRMRQHPDPRRDIWQYRLSPPPSQPDRFDVVAASEGRDPWVRPEGSGASPVAGQGSALQHDQSVSQRPPEPLPSGPPAAPLNIEPSEPPVYPKPERPGQISSAVKRKEDGTYEYVPPQRPIQELTDLPEPPQPTGQKFDRLPAQIDFGSVAVCPRCHARSTRGPVKKKPVDEETLRKREMMQRRKKGNVVPPPSMVDDYGYLLHRDPYNKKHVPCPGCNGYGYVPNVGPIALTMPE